MLFRMNECTTEHYRDANLHRYLPTLRILPQVDCVQKCLPTYLTITREPDYQITKYSSHSSGIIHTYLPSTPRPSTTTLRRYLSSNHSLLMLHVLYTKSENSETQRLPENESDFGGNGLLHTASEHHCQVIAPHLALLPTKRKSIRILPKTQHYLRPETNARPTSDVSTYMRACGSSDWRS